MLRNRIFTAVLLLSVLIVVLGVLRIPWLTLTLVSSFVLIGGIEFAGMRWGDFSDSAAEVQTPPFRKSHIVLGILYVLPIILVHFLVEIIGQPVLVVPFLIGFFVVAGLFLAVFLYRSCSGLDVIVSRWLYAMGGFVYLALPALAITRLLMMDTESAVSGAAFWFSLVIVAMGDTGAYFTGVNFGKNKMLPMVSPKKTWEGAIGGIICSGLSAWFLGYLWNFSMPWYVLISAGVLIGGAGQVGDLVESAIKRVARCKDSGAVFPGHGGVLDRIDSLLFAAPLAYAFFVYYGVVS